MTNKEKLLAMICDLTVEEIVDLMDYDIWSMANEDINNIDDEALIAEMLDHANGMALANMLKE